MCGGRKMSHLLQSPLSPPGATDLQVLGPRETRSSCAVNTLCVAVEYSPLLVPELCSEFQGGKKAKARPLGRPRKTRRGPAPRHGLHRSGQKRWGFENLDSKFKTPAGAGGAPAAHLQRSERRGSERRAGLCGGTWGSSGVTCVATRPGVQKSDLRPAPHHLPQQQPHAPCCGAAGAAGRPEEQKPGLHCMGPGRGVGDRDPGRTSGVPGGQRA